jgi:benzoyl-CoA 2,3-dioxygenase component B
MKISTFDDWKEYFKQWQRDVGIEDVASSVGGLGSYEFKVGFGDLKSDEVEFGDFKGDRKWETVLQIPDQRARDSVMELIRYQGDTEFASSEQQRSLIETAPSKEDLQSLIRVMREEGRHGWQMAYLLVTYFGDDGKREAQKLLERRSSAMSGTRSNRRLLWAFNERMDHWIDFFYYTELVDRDGKFQLDMLSRCGFAPLARSTTFMLGEEAYHLRTGHLGLKRTVKANVIPHDIMQKYLNKWMPCALDLFGKDNSSTAIWTYVWGLKSRFNESKQPDIAGEDRSTLNELSRMSFYREVQGLIEQLNRVAPDGRPELVLPDPKFGRKIGEHAEQPYSVTGEKLSPQEYEKHLEQVLPGPSDVERLETIFKSGQPWLEPWEAPNKEVAV